MPEKKISKLLAKNQKTFKYLTAFMFFLLVAEKLISMLSTNYDFTGSASEKLFYIHDNISLLVYISMTVLIALNVKYKFLLIPDTFLLIAKVSIIVISFITLLNLNESDIISRVTLIEIIVEGALFTLFLLVFFAGKLFKGHERIAEKIPIICLGCLVFAFPATVIFEIIKIILEANLHQHSFRTAMLNFSFGILNEAFLDLPYFLLTLLVYFTPKESTVHNKQTVVKG